MDRRERTNDFQTAIAAALEALQADIWTALPGIVQSVNWQQMTAVIQPSVQAQVQNRQGVWTNMSLPLLLDCPIKFPGGGGYSQTFPLKQGDEVLVVFASRCMNAWWSQSGVQPQEEIRMHDLSDGFCIPRVWSKPNALSNVSATKPQWRSDDGTVIVELDKATGQVNITAPGGLWINGIKVTVP